MYITGSTCNMLTCLLWIVPTSKWVELKVEFGRSQTVQPLKYSNPTTTNINNQHHHLFYQHHRQEPAGLWGFHAELRPQPGFWPQQSGHHHGTVTWVNTAIMRTLFFFFYKSWCPSVCWCVSVWDEYQFFGRMNIRIYLLP